MTDDCPDTACIHVHGAGGCAVLLFVVFGAGLLGWLLAWLLR